MSRYRSCIVLYLALVSLLLFFKGILALSKRGEPADGTYVKYFKMPGAVPKKDDDYLCTGMAVNSTEEWIIMYDPLASANRAHHMLLYGCSGIKKNVLDSKIWDCGHHGVCQGNKIMFAWAKNAPGIHLPPDVGFRIGSDSKIKFLTLQIHYAKTLPEGVKDESGLKMTLTTAKQKYKAGIYLLGSGFVDIPPRTPKTHADSNCLVGVTEPEPINIFGFRVHAHSLGSVITGYKYNPKTKELIQIVKGNPQWPQAFYPLDSILKVEPEEILHARCTYNSTTRDRHTYIGQSSKDEMCNLYLMYYTDREKGSESGSCWMEFYKDITKQLPASSDEPLAANKELEAMTVGENVNKNTKISYTSTVEHNSTSGSELKSHFNAEKALAAYGQDSKETGANENTYIKSIQMPGVTPKEADSYICTAIALNSSAEEWVILFKPLASASRAHHMLLFGCSDVKDSLVKQGSWDCGHHGICTGGKIMYAWAKNAPATHLPRDVGFKMGGKSNIKYLALQIHYANPLPEGIKDKSGLQMTITTTPQKYKAGIFLLASSYVDIPPYTEKTHADINCNVGVTEPVDINIFAFRVHAHKLGNVISGYKYSPDENLLTEIAKGNPHWPQAFYPMNEVTRVKPTDILHARCTYNSSTSIKHTYIGATSNDEMCNLYLMYYTDAEKGSESGGCGGENYRTITAALPPSSDEPLPPNPELEIMTMGVNKNKDKEVSYSNLFESQTPIEIEKKTQSRKDPKQPGFGDYDYPSYEGYDYLQPQFNLPVRNWNSKPSQDYFNINERLRAEGKYQLKPKPVQIYDDFEQNNAGTLENLPFYSKDSDKKISIPESEKRTFVSSPRQGKQLNSGIGFQLVENWGPVKYELGQISGVVVDSRGDVVIFHRGMVTWDGSSFISDVLVDQSNPIAQPTLLHLQRKDGSVMHEWGANFFYMPHGLSLDYEDNLWLTDVGMHQVFKFPSGFGEGKPLLTLGTKFKPGNDDNHFCKPTSVAILKNGEFFVSDGYCNSRIIHYSASGKIIKQFGSQSSLRVYFNGESPKEATFNIPHALTLVEDHNEICAADRENGRIQCFKTDSGTYQRQFKFDEWGKRLFSLVYTPRLGGKIFAVNGPQFFGKQKVEIYEVSFSDGKLERSFSPYNQGLSNPHDIAISSNGTDLYVVEIGPNKIWKFVSDVAPKNRSTSSIKSDPNYEVKTGELKEVSPNTLSLFSGGYSSLEVSSVVLGLLAVPIIVLSSLAIIMKCRRKDVRNRYLENGKFINSLNGKQKNGGLNLGSLLNKRRGFEQVATNDIDADDLDSADSDIEEFSLTATKV